jgi:hypothetical protein
MYMRSGQDKYKISPDDFAVNAGRRDYNQSIDNEGSMGL